MKGALYSLPAETAKNILAARLYSHLKDFCILELQKHIAANNSSRNKPAYSGMTPFPGSDGLRINSKDIEDSASRLSASIKITAASSPQDFTIEPEAVCETFLWHRDYMIVNPKCHHSRHRTQSVRLRTPMPESALPFSGGRRMATREKAG